MVSRQQKMIRGPVTLTGIHSSGRCMATYENKSVYLDFGIPGEIATFVMNRRTQGYRSGELIDVISPSPNRVDPFCPHYRHCGGCSWQHMDYSLQLALKHDILTAALKKYEIRTPEIPAVIPSPDIRHFRHRLEYTFASTSTWIFSDNARNSVSVMGFHHYGEPGKIVDIRECYLQPDPSRAICDFVKSYSIGQGFEFYNHVNKTGFLRSLSLRINPVGEVLVLVGFAEDNPVQREMLLTRLLEEFQTITSLCWTLHHSPGHGQMQGEIIPFGGTEPFMHVWLAGNQFRIHASSFFQPNTSQAEQILILSREWANLTGHEKVYDLYTGVGTIALSLAPQAGQVTGIEGSSFAIEDARENALVNGIGNAAFITGDILETFTPEFLAEHGKPDLVVLDPPRSGTLIEIKKTINASGARRVLYLSCNPVSLAFDLKQLTEAYQVTRIQPFDMLPHTHHLEILVLLEHKTT